MCFRCGTPPRRRPLASESLGITSLHGKSRHRSWHVSASSPLRDRRCDGQVECRHAVWDNHSEPSNISAYESLSIETDNFGYRVGVPTSRRRRPDLMHIRVRRGALDHHWNRAHRRRSSCPTNRHFDWLRDDREAIGPPRNGCSGHGHDKPHCCDNDLRPCRDIPVAHFDPPDVFPIRNSTTSPSCMT